MDCKQIYKIKQGEFKECCISYKTTLVAKDFTQSEEIDYNKIFSHVIMLL